MKLALSRIHYPITALGPGKRIGIWFQGCSIRCPGCISADTWNFGEGTTTVEDLIAAIEPWFSEADGVTISGGEPFDQAEQLAALLKELRTRVNGDVLVYSGHTFAHISQRLATMAGLIDVIITGPFLIDETQKLPLRGSDNQELHILTSLGDERYGQANNPLDNSANSADNARHQKTLDIMFDDDNNVWIAGIPKRGELEKISKILQIKGFESVTTEDGGGRY